MSESSKATQSNHLHSVRPLETLGDFTTNWRVIPISGLAIVIGVVSAYVALLLLRLIGFFTNIFFYGRIRWDLVSPAGHHLGYWVVLVPVIGGLNVGLMARFGSDRIRGHGIPEAIEAILLRGADNGYARNVRLAEIPKAEPLVAHPDEPLRIVVNRMAASSVTRFPVAEWGNDNCLIGMIACRTC